PSPEVMPLFRLFRRRDVNLNLGIAEREDELTYYCFNEPALNGFSKELSEKRDTENSPYRLLKAISVKTMPLKKVLDEYLPKGQHIDFLSIDAEGFDLIVLKSNDWQHYRPSFVLVEDDIDLSEMMESEIYKQMSALHYKLVAKTSRTLIFQDDANSIQND